MTKKILSFDGGGIRGVVSLTLLSQLEKELGINLANSVDLFAGTSTGSIIAAALAVGMNTEEILEFYKGAGKEIFSSSQSFFDEMLHIDTKYSSQNLYTAIKMAFQSKNIDPNMPLKQLKKQIVIPAVSLDDQVFHRWRMEILSNVLSDHENVSLIDAMMRSTAAPTFFPSYQGFVDGGVAANDPSLVACATIHSGSPNDPIKLLSIGTGFTKHDIQKGEAWGPLSWIIHFTSGRTATDTPLLSLLFDVQEQLVAQLSKLFFGKNSLRLNVELHQAIPLDGVSQIPTLIELTQTFIQKNPDQWKKNCEWVLTEFLGEKT